VVDSETCHTNEFGFYLCSQIVTQVNFTCPDKIRFNLTCPNKIYLCVRADYWPLKRPIYILCRERSSLCIITYCGMRTDFGLILSSASQTTCATRNHISLSPVCCMYSLTSTFLHRPVIDHGCLCCSYVGCTHSVSIGKYKSFTIVYILLQCTCYSFDERKKTEIFISVAYCCDDGFKCWNSACSASGVVRSSYGFTVSFVHGTYYYLKTLRR
jgi:hypothetical protein